MLGGKRGLRTYSVLAKGTCNSYVVQAEFHTGNDSAQNGAALKSRP